MALKNFVWAVLYMQLFVNVLFGSILILNKEATFPVFNLTIQAGFIGGTFLVMTFLLFIVLGFILSDIFYLNKS